MTPEVGWNFPSTNSGREDGWNDSGMSHFTGAPLSSLARETIQNSLDAKLFEEKPVEVVFELKNVKPGNIGGEELNLALVASRWSVGELGDLGASQALARAQSILEQREVSCLQVSDQNTIGLPDKNWHALTKMQGLSQKEGVEGAGGSHGIGKYAPFAVSSLRTVFYWTCYEQADELVEKFQGKAVLMSHGQGNFRTQGTGFYGVKQGCEALTTQVPALFRIGNHQGDLIRGTSLLIIGFNEVRNWQQRIAASVIENYFHAIASGSLIVTIEPDQNTTGTGDFEISDATLANWFSKLESLGGEESMDEDGNDLLRVRAYWELTDNTITVIEKQDDVLGHCRLWIRVGDGLPSRVALVRRTGMLVTDQQAGLMRFSSYKDFVAMCVFEDPSGNELLRRMENPRHDKFEPTRLPEDEREKGRRALNRITRWIRDEIRKQAGPPKGGKTTLVSELAVYLPELQPDEPFDDTSSDHDEGARERGLGGRVTLKLRPIRQPAPPLPKSEEGDGDGSGNDRGDSGGGGVGDGGDGEPGGPGEGEGEGGQGGRGGGTVRTQLPISGVSILPLPGSGNRYRLSFRPGKSGTANLELEEAGDSTTSPLEDVYATDGSTLQGLALIEGERKSIEIIAENPIQERALRVTAVEEDK